MNPIARPLQIGTLVAFAFLALGAQAAGPTDVNRCGAISSPGSYVVTRNIAATGNCIHISADNVTLDFAGFVMSGDGTGDGVQVDATSVTLKNGTITGFIAGIALVSHSLLDVTGNIIDNMQVRNNTAWGVAGGSAIVRNSVFTGHGNTAIALNDGSIVTGNRVVGNRAGIAVQIGSVVQGNVVLSNTNAGIMATCPSLVMGNTSVNNGPLNLFLSGAGCTVDHNVAP